MGFSSEIYLTKNYITKEEWLELIKNISIYNGLYKSWQITIAIKNNEISYHLNTKFKVPSTINNLSSFFIKEEPDFNIKTKNISLPIILPLSYNTIDCLNYSNIKKLGNIKYINLKFRKISKNKIISNSTLYIENNNNLIKVKMLLALPINLLSIDFSNNKTYFYKKIPKYLDITKIIKYLNPNKENSNLIVDTFPYLNGNYYLSPNIDFNKHTLILGSSGTGKSKFISLMIKNIYQTNKKNYRIVMIDPHTSIEKDIGGIGKTIDFKTIEDSINLFSATTEDIIANTELTLELLKSLIKDQYNSKLERVLRHSIYLLLTNNSFSFNTLKTLILDINYRTQIINSLNNKLPNSIIDFFLNDYNDLRTKSYSESISPIISFIDEMEMIPVLNNENLPYTLEQTISNNFLTLFSLDKTKLGDKVIKTISGFIMQQLFTLIQKNTFKEHIIFIIDEIALIENPILCRFLSEARKYNLSLIIAGQYFNQVSNSLKDAIFANIINYYIFRISRNDASLLVDNLDIKIPLLNNKSIPEQKEEKINLLSTLNNRECIAKISINNQILPSFKAKTLDFIAIPRIKDYKINIQNNINQSSNNKKITFNTENIAVKDILKNTSSSRVVLNNER